MVATVTRNGAPKCCLKPVRNAKNSTLKTLLGNLSALRGREFPYLEGPVPNSAIGCKLAGVTHPQPLPHTRRYSIKTVDSQVQVTRFQFTLEMEISLVLTVFLLSLILIHWITANRSPQIPGPPPHPFVGHTFQVPIVKTWRYFEKLSLKYGVLQCSFMIAVCFNKLNAGPIVKLTLAGDDMIVLSNPSDAEELASTWPTLRAQSK
jgi:hypothetical protein